MKKSFLLLVSLLLLITGCGEVKEEGTLYTKDDIFVDCIKIDYPEGFTSKLIIIKDIHQKLLFKIFLTKLIKFFSTIH